jgi:hypothetical protein
MLPDPTSIQEARALFITTATTFLISLKAIPKSCVQHFVSEPRFKTRMGATRISSTLAATVLHSPPISTSAARPQGAGATDRVPDVRGREPDDWRLGLGPRPRQPHGGRWGGDYSFICNVPRRHDASRHHGAAYPPRPCRHSLRHRPVHHQDSRRHRLHRTCPHGLRRWW